ncbi:DMT family transporter [Sporosalibacterium faouarense]|uniref:DMT family transporter n=1 Tax=Sporosalibacterium faouarense TaxID=516123 RepID=UPI00141C18D7|nr:DMT family transporter [Sporosalibacterium faouarense]MTI47140.1 DMT family transporter [Bacillota bacterium]
MNNLVSAFIGALISLMIMINGTLANFFGNYVSTIIIHIVGLFSIVAVIIISRSKIKIHNQIPLYLYSAGAIGVFTVLFNNFGFSILGVSIPLALGLLGQSLTSIIIDHFGLLGMKVDKFNKKKYIGLSLIILGIFIMTIS